ncbi:MAG: hydrogenase formation protein HypD [Symbiobacterium sp.]|uniref:hydrogenase formation protein HypD n=1 Tax=Symbiobacterium sp. TaxID=1971213 RepID=UPI00346459F0
MQYLDEFRRSDYAGALAAAIREEADQLGRPVRLMELCGGHTHAIYKYAVDEFLPENIKLIHGPGCPVCVTPRGRVAHAIALAKQPGVIFTSFGDMLRVPGDRGSLLQARAQGADVRMVYSPLDALALARKNPDRKVVFFAIGFETTAPTHAMAVLRARREGIRNFFLLTSLVLMPPAVEAILNSPDLALDGFIGPGHACTISGTIPYEFVARRYGRPVVVSGFEPLDLLQSVLMVLRQLNRGEPKVEIQYRRLVRPEGNPKAWAAVEQVFEPRTVEWRGLGVLPQSGLRLRPEYQEMDAEVAFPEVAPRQLDDPRTCECGSILRGAKAPWECRIFGTACTPENPIGACMVSPEGACAAFYKYGHRLKERAGV